MTAPVPRNIAYGYPTPGPQSPTPHDVLDSVFFLDDDAWDEARDHGTYDYIVIGTSFCGYAFVERILCKDPKARILMLERGPYFLAEHFQNLPQPYVDTLGGLSETFPWTVSHKTATEPAGTVHWLHGSVPFFGGRSIMWSSWCPRPIPAEMDGWSAKVVADATAYFQSAEDLLGVIPADQIDATKSDELKAALADAGRPVYGTMQLVIEKTIAANLSKIPSATRSMAAPLAVGAGRNTGIDFAKASTPGPLLGLIDAQAAKATAGQGATLSVATETLVNRIVQEDGHATAIETSRGTIVVGIDAKVILAMGAMAPATLLTNSFPNTGAGDRFTGHFITAVVARIKRADFTWPKPLEDLELAAVYVAGMSPAKKQYHVQLSVLSDTKPVPFAARAQRYMPDVVATASPAQLAGSKDYLVFVCAVLGELDWANPSNAFRRNDGTDPTTNMTLQILTNQTDQDTWNTMDTATFQLLENAISPQGRNGVEYWWVDPADPTDPAKGSWKSGQPPQSQIRVPGLVHEGSTLFIGASGEGPVGDDYRPKNIDNVYVTGAGLWPRAGSWNPTMTMVALAQALADGFTSAGPCPPAAAATTSDEPMMAAVE